MHVVETVLVVLLLGAVSGIAARYVRGIPLPLIQIALGALLSWPNRGLHIAFDPELFLLLFIPPLLFADGWRIPKREFFALHRPILRLALGLVLFTVLGLGWLIHWMIPQIPLPVAFALAAVVSPTDAVAVSAITRNLGMPVKTMHVLQGESLLNDASGLVALKFAVAATLTGQFSLAQASGEFLWLALGGVAVGTLIGLGFAQAREVISRRLGDVAATQMVLLLVLLPFAAYLAGEYLAVSGILSAVAAGVATNFADLRRGDFVIERIHTQSTWEMVESSFNGAIFLLLGLQLPGIIGVTLEAAGERWWHPAGQAVAISLALLALRWIWLRLGVSGTLWWAHRLGRMAEQPSPLLALATTLAGIRGAVTLAGALSVPLLLPSGASFPARDLLVFLATGTILCTMVIGSIGLPLVLRRLPPAGEPAAQFEERQARLAACRAAIERLGRDLEAGAADDTDADPDQDRRATSWREAALRVTQDYRQRIEMLEAPDAALSPELLADSADARHTRQLRYVAELDLRLRSLHVERNALYAERRAHRINDVSLRSLVAELDLSEISLRRRRDVARRTVGLPPLDERDDA